MQRKGVYKRGKVGRPVHKVWNTRTAWRDLNDNCVSVPFPESLQKADLVSKNCIRISRCTYDSWQAACGSSRAHRSPEGLSTVPRNGTRMAHDWHPRRARLTGKAGKNRRHSWYRWLRNDTFGKVTTGSIVRGTHPQFREIQGVYF